MLLREKWGICAHEAEGKEVGCFELSREKDNAF